MTTSGVSTFSINRDEIIRTAMLNLQKLEGSEVPTAQEITDCARFLNMLVKQWQGTTDFAPGLKTWTRRHGHLFLHSTVSQYTLGPLGTGWTLNFVSTTLASSAAAGVGVVTVASAAGMTLGDYFGVITTAGDFFWTSISLVVGMTVTLRDVLPASCSSGAMVRTYSTPASQPIKIETVFLRDQYNSDTPVLELTQAQYDNLPSKTDPNNVGDPAFYYNEFQLGNSYLFTDVAGAQDVTKHLCITYLEAEQDFVNPLDTPEYPQEWYLALALNLSKQIAPMFAAAWTPLMEDNAKMALMIAQKKEPERIVAHFQPGEESL